MSEYVTAKQAAKRSGIGEAQIRKWLADPVDHIPYIQIGKVRKFRYEAFIDYVIEHES